MRQWETESVIGLFLSAAEIARRIKSDPRVELKSDRTPVSDADREIENLLSGEFGPGNLLGEETFSGKNHDSLIDRLLHERMWIVDPIDGTVNFINRRPFWGISIGYAENGTITRGGVYLPETGQLLITGDDGKTMFADVGRPFPAGEEIRKMLKPAHLPARPFNDASSVNLSQVFTKRGIFTGPNPVVTVGSCICSGVDLVLGRDAVYLTHAKLWDLAGILPCLANLGFYAAGRNGLSALSCRITPELFQLEADARTPFALREPQWIGNSREAVENIMPLCRI